jgi:hypothetical protein
LFHRDATGVKIVDPDRLRAQPPDIIVERSRVSAGPSLVYRCDVCDLLRTHVAVFENGIGQPRDYRPIVADHAPCDAHGVGQYRQVISPLLRRGDGRVPHGFLEVRLCRIEQHIDLGFLAHPRFGQ